MAEIHHFAYGWFTPVVSFGMAFLGSLLGLACAARAREARTRGRQTRWLLIAAVSIGGAGIWLMHFMAMLGFDVSGTPVRYDPTLIIGSMALGVGPVAVGLVMVRRTPRTLSRLFGGGLFTGMGVLCMHYSGMLGMRVAGTIAFDPGLVAASAVIAVVAATAALWFATSVKGWAPTLLASGVMATAVCGMHYTGMAAVRVRLSPEPVRVDGLSPFLLIVPITLLCAAALIGLAFSALQAMTEEEFDGATRGRHRGGGSQARPAVAWTLQPSLSPDPARTNSAHAGMPVPARPQA